MRRLSDTLTRLATARRRGLDTPPAAGPLKPLTGFGSNPGALNALHYVPHQPDGAPLVVVLHGCTQNAAGYDGGTGWTQLAQELGFAVLLPEQTRANNFNLCFNWYETGDSRRDGGEPMSIRQMVEAMVERFGLDRERVFVTGLSAGGAMASVMLATCPELFAGGAIVAGLPYGSATSLPQAFDRMRGHGGPTGAGLARLVSAATTHSGSWPTISVWHGSADGTVDQANADAIVEQWSPLHGVAAEPSYVEERDGARHRIWRDAAGRAVIEDWRIAGMGHGTPVSTADDEACGTGGAYMLDVGISSTRVIARSWGLGTVRPDAARGTADATKANTRAAPAIAAAATRIPTIMPRRPAAADPMGIGKVIDDALRAAGLTK